MDSGLLKDDGTIDIDFNDMAVEYFVRVVPGSLVEMEDEKQMRILNQLFIPLSQAMPALANSGDQAMLQQASQAMQYIVQKQIELSGSSSAQALGKIFRGEGDEVTARDEKVRNMEEALNGMTIQMEMEQEIHAEAIVQMQKQISMMAENQQLLLEKLGVMNTASTDSSPTSAGTVPPEGAPAPTVTPVSA